MNKGDFVKIDYIGKTDTGEIFDLTDEKVAKENDIFNPNYPYKPIPVIVGEGFVVKGLDEALQTMNVGEEKTVTVEPSKGFGERDPKMVKLIPEKEFQKQNIQPQPGLVLDFQGFKGRIQSVSAGRVRVDFNNPLAGRTLTYNLKIVEQIDKADEKVKSFVEFLTGLKTNVKINEKQAEVEVIEGRELPQGTQRNLSDMITKYVKEVESVKFSTTFSKGQAGGDDHHGHDHHDHSHEGHDHSHHNHDHDHHDHDGHGHEHKH